MNFDFPQVIQPQPKDNIEVYDIAIPKQIVKNILKGYKLVTVENQNDQHYNLALGEKGYLFLPASNSREVFLTVKGDPNMLGLRDRDYFKENEISAIQAKFPNLRILHYYAFENYVYHPDNLAELQLEGYSRDEYIKEIVDQKNAKLLSIVGDVAVARQTCIEFKDVIKNDGDIQPIIQALQHNEFEVFYPYFSMKSHYNKVYLNKYNLSARDLVTTNWFKAKLQAILESANQ